MTQGHVGSDWRSWDLTPGLSGSQHYTRGHFVLLSPKFMAHWVYFDFQQEIKAHPGANGGGSVLSISHSNIPYPKCHGSVNLLRLGALAFQVQPLSPTLWAFHGPAYLRTGWLVQCLLLEAGLLTDEGVSRGNLALIYSQTMTEVRMITVLCRPNNQGQEHTQTCESHQDLPTRHSDLSVFNKRHFPLPNG